MKFLKRLLFSILSLSIADSYDLLSYSKNASYPELINLNESNFITIRNEINKESASKFIYDLNTIENKKNIYVYLDTPGGSVEDGNKIISEVKKYKLSCIVDRAYSMGFAILQACKERLILPHGKLMQHQISYGLKNENAKVLSYIKFINQLEKELVEFQAKRLRMRPDIFRLKTMNEWWLYGKNAIKRRAADRLVEVKCNEKLTKMNETIESSYAKVVYSKCPLISDPIEIIKSKESNNFPFFI